MFVVFAARIYSEYYKKNLTPNTLLAAHIIYFIALVFHAFVLARNIRKQIFIGRKLLKKVLPETIKQLKERFPDKDIQLWFQLFAFSGQRSGGEGEKSERPCQRDQYDCATQE